MSVSDQLTASILRDIYMEVDKEIIDSIMANSLSYLHSDPIKLKAYILYMLDRDFDYISKDIRLHIAIMSAISIQELRSMFTLHIKCYQPIHIILSADDWVTHLVSNYSDYEQHLLGILPDLREVVNI